MTRYFAGMAKKTKATAVRSDGWSNIYTALGTTTRDKRLGASFKAESLDEQTCEELWEGDDICARIIEAQPEAELREGFELVISDPSAGPTPLPPDRTDAEDGSGGSELAQKFMTRFDELDVTETLIEARCFARAYGGSAILVGADDGQSLDQPLDERRIKSVNWLKVLRPRECWPARYYRNIKSPKFGTISHYRVQRETLGGGSAGVLEVHASRLITFLGVVVSTRQRARRQGWGDSVLVRCIEKVMDFQASFQASGILIQDFAQAVFKMKGLANAMMNGEDDIMVNRARAIDLSRSVARAILIDEGEEFERKTTPVAGLPDLLDRQCNRLSAAARMPVSLLVGMAPAGLNATGDADVRNWYDSVKGDRERKLRPRHNRLIKLIMLAADSPSKGKEPKQWKVKYHSPWQMTDKEIAELRNKQADTDQKYVSAGILLPEEVAVSRFGGDDWSMETQLDDGARAAAEAAIKAQPEDPNIVKSGKKQAGAEQ